jgi:ribosomal protein L16 Arg81 hydroxylase
MAKTVKRLRDVLAPLAQSEFLSRDWGRRYRYIRGRAARFESLLPWPVLNDVIQQHRLVPPRVRVAKDGEVIPSSAYQRHDSDKWGMPVPRVLGAELSSLLRQGATLVVEHVDEVHEPITELCRALERDLGEYVSANAYAGFGRSRGFDKHWDVHDVFVLQLAGRKRWRVFGPSKEHPPIADTRTSKRPPRRTIWAGVLSPGDVLYLPRGWWHDAAAIGEPTLHLTFGIRNKTGVDFFEWLLWRTASCACAVPSAHTRSWWRFPASGAVSALRAARGAWPRAPRIWSTR